MHHRITIAVLSALVMTITTGRLVTQVRRPPARRPAATLPPRKEAPEIICPTPLGIGVSTKLEFCDVMSERDPTAGVIIRFPEHKGPLTLTFDLHNRHTYSEEQVKSNRA